MKGSGSLVVMMTFEMTGCTIHPRVMNSWWQGVIAYRWGWHLMTGSWGTPCSGWQLMTDDREWGTPCSGWQLMTDDREWGTPCSGWQLMTGSWGTPCSGWQLMTGSGSLVLCTADDRELGNPVFWLTADDRWQGVGNPVFWLTADDRWQGVGNPVFWLTTDDRELGNPVFWLTADDREW